MLMHWDKQCIIKSRSFYGNYIGWKNDKVDMQIS